MTIGKICQREVDLAGRDETVQAAAQRMANRNVGSLLVLDADRRPIGIVTDRDLALRVVGQGRLAATTTVSEVMTPEPETVREDVPIERALARMRAASLRRLPVVDGEGRLAGVVTLDDVVELLAEEFGEIRRLLDQTSPRALAGKVRGGDGRAGHEDGDR